MESKLKAPLDVGMTDDSIANMESETLLSIITPAFNEEENLPHLYSAIMDTLGSLDLEWEWIIIDDHSTDNTFLTISKLALENPRIKGFRFSRNFGSHQAITCGLQQSQGDCAVVMAADLQDPPETIPDLMQVWQEGTHVVWAVREGREGEKKSTVYFANMYYYLMRKIVGIKEIPATGADFFLIDRRVIQALQSFNESNISLMALITWMGFTQSSITYTKQARLYGSSGWSLSKKLKLIVDSVTSFSFFPIRVMSYLGILIALLGFIYAGIVVINSLFGNPAEGWSSLMVVVLVVGGAQMLMMGILGEYLWRTLDEARQRPHHLIEATTADANNLNRMIDFGVQEAIN